MAILTGATRARPGTNPGRASITIAFHAARDQLTQAATSSREPPST
jgi:hypothetical protein